MAAKNKVVVIGGPTASGKSAVAMDVARAFDGVVINGDALQIYDALPMLTARPSAEDEASVPHRLYGTMAPTETCSAGLWEGHAIDAIKQAWAQEKLPIVTGGTGLYLKTLVEGISKLPPIPEDIRQAVRDQAEQDGIAPLYEELSRDDPEMAARLKPADKQRICRAVEVFRATGQSLAHWQRENKPEPTLKADYATHIIMPPRALLYERCNKRFDWMIEQGALDEVAQFTALHLDKNLPIMKALGLSELQSYLAGHTALEDAIEQAKQQTRRFAKRQCTWFRNQMGEPEIHAAQYSESLKEEIYKKVRQFLLTPPS